MSGFALHFLRHGAPEQPGLMLGRTDVAPTAEGIAACVRQVSDLDIGRIISSDLQRCRLPAAGIGETRNLAPQIDPRWRELDFGDWDGKAASAIDPEPLGRFWADPDENPPPRGERWSALVARITSALADLSPHPTLIVTHAGAIRAALHCLCGIARPQLWAFDLPYGARLSLHIWPGDPAVAQIRTLRA
ncbi:histidine phosphatase family protein [Sphingobium lactosutens]|uniref:histidine phosphatase family protein n=1 Tax=Sphingobium lactosutens TaxID=522773 RepID=UPI0015BD3671|nr:histidine phosphatase family protein [Sphingobium lactosutens]